MNDNHTTKDEWLLDFFGFIGRELGDPIQRFTDNPQEIFEFINKCTENKKPAFMSVQPRTEHGKVYGIEKIFFDFDYADKTFVKQLEQKIKDGKLTEKDANKIMENRKCELEYEVRVFINSIKNFPETCIEPLIVRTRKGFHIYIFFDKIYEIDDNDEHWKNVYGELQDIFLSLTKYEYKYIDPAILGDIMRMARIPMSIHEKSGEECQILDVNLKPTKLRTLNFYRGYGLREKDLKIIDSFVKEKEKSAKEIAKQHQEENREQWEGKHGFVGKIRPCFQTRIDLGEMCHQQRLALLIEAFYVGYNTVEKMVDLFRRFKDFSEKETRYQVEWFFDHKIDERSKKCDVFPYRCDTIIESGWCLKEECQTYKKRKNHESR